VALGVSYPIGSLVQGPLADALGLAWTTAGASALLAIVLFALGLLRPGVFQVLAAPSSTEPQPAEASR
jgi:predicted MFS family arabinose efflux permease